MMRPLPIPEAVSISVVYAWPSDSARPRVDLLQTLHSSSLSKLGNTHGEVILGFGQLKRRQTRQISGDSIAVAAMVTRPLLA
ncbi:MAG: hypothetical protein ABJK25_01125 [Halieaceae bacterium]